MVLAHMEEETLESSYRLYLVVSLTIVVLAAGVVLATFSHGSHARSSRWRRGRPFPHSFSPDHVQAAELGPWSLTEMVSAPRSARKAANISWQEIESISDTEGTIVISRKNLNAFLVPQRAFQSEQERAGVLTAFLWRGWAHTPMIVRRATKYSALPNLHFLGTYESGNELEQSQGGAPRRTGGPQVPRTAGRIDPEISRAA